MLLKVHPSGGGKGEPVLYMGVLGIGLLSQFESDHPQLSQSNSKNKECGAASYRTSEVATDKLGAWAAVGRCELVATLWLSFTYICHLLVLHSSESSRILNNVAAPYGAVAGHLAH